MIVLFEHGGYFDLDTVKTEVAALESQMSSTDFWNDTQNAQKVSKHAADLRSELATWESFIAEIDELLELCVILSEAKDLAFQKMNRSIIDRFLICKPRKRKNSH